METPAPDVQSDGPETPVVVSGRINPDRLPVGRFLYHITPGPASTLREGEVIETHKGGSEFYLKLQPGGEWVRATHCFVVTGLPPAPASKPEPDGNLLLLEAPAPTPAPKARKK